MYSSNHWIDDRLIRERMREIDRELEQQRLIREAEAASRPASRSSILAILAAAIRALGRARSSSLRQMSRLSASRPAR